MEKIKKAKIDELVPDDLNMNKGTEFGGHLIEKSLRTLGAGRSILLDKNNRIIAGNKTVENAAAIGLDNVIIVETTGDQIVAVKRTDIDLDSQKGRELALADNATSKANLDWDKEAIAQVTENWEVDAEGWGVRCIEEFNMEDLELKNNAISGEANKYSFSITFNFPKEEQEKFDRFQKSELEKILIDYVNA